MRILAFDPSMTATGYALLIDDGSPDGQLVEAGRITPGGGCNAEQAWALYGQVLEEIAAKLGESHPPADLATVHHKPEPARIVVEVPFTQARGGVKARRSAATLPTYGMAVGAVVCAAKASGWDVSTVPAGEWSRGLPSTATDKYKERRVRYAAALYRQPVEEFGAKSVAGDVADAVLLARWSMLWAREGRRTA